MDKKKEIVRLFYPCVECKDEFKVERILKAHMLHIHKKFIPPNTEGTERPEDDKSEFQVEGNFHEDYDLKRLGYASCWSHFEIDDLQAYYTHQMEKHPLVVDLTDYSEDEDNGNAAAESINQAQEIEFSDGAKHGNSLGPGVIGENTGGADEEDEGFVAEYAYNSKSNIMPIINAELGEICGFLKERFYQQQA